MAYSEKILSSARARLEQEQAAHEKEYAMRIETAYQQQPRLKELDFELRRVAMQAVNASFQRGDSPQQTISELKEASLELQREREWLLDAAGYEDGWLDETPLCPHCNDRGYRDGKMCACLKKHCVAAQQETLAAAFVDGGKTFADFRLEFYPDTVDLELGASPRRIMRTTLQNCVQYAKSFTPHSESLLFSGATGLGKTLLSACIARQVADRGCSVSYTTALDLFADYEAAKFGSFGGDARAVTKKYTDCDLLIIDDLGTELTTQFTVSCLYAVIDSRLRLQKPTIVSTNLTPELLEARYSPQIASRLRGAFRLVQFLGSDIRMMK